MREISLPADLRAQLDRLKLRIVVEYLASRLDIDDGEWEVRLRLTNGQLRESGLERRRIRNEELEFLARPDSVSL